MSNAIDHLTLVWALDEARIWDGDDPRDATAIVRRRRAGRYVASVADVALSRIVYVRLTEHFDWERLRVNVYHLVAPKLVRWK